MTLCKLLIAAVAAASLASLATAHPGPRIFLGVEGGRVTTYLGNNNETSTQFAAERIFTTPLPSVAGVYTNNFPGFQVAEGHGVNTGTTFGFDIAGPLLVFDAAASGGNGAYRTVADYFSGGTVPQMAVSQKTLTRTTASGAVSGFDFFTYNAPGDHGHDSFTLLGNGTTAGGGPAGVYALPLTVHASGLAESQSFYLLLGKDVDLTSTQFATAESVARLTLVPEPTALARVMIGAAALLRRSCRR